MLPSAPPGCCASPRVLLKVPSRRALRHGLLWRSAVTLRGPSSPCPSSTLGLTISLASRSLKYSKYLLQSGVRNVFGIDHIQKVGYCICEIWVRFVRGELCQPVVFCPLSLLSHYFCRVEGSCTQLLPLLPIHNLFSPNMTEIVSLL